MIIVGVGHAGNLVILWMCCPNFFKPENESIPPINDSYCEHMSGISNHVSGLSIVCVGLMRYSNCLFGHTRKRCRDES